MGSGKVGKATVVVSVANPLTRKSVYAKALIDTGADHAVIPRKLAEELEIEVRGEEWIKTGNGPAKVKFGYAEMTLNGHLGVMRVWISDKIDKVLIGVLMLEDMGLKVNSVNGTLEEDEQALYAISS